MQTIIIRLDPHRLKNPDTDLCYRVSERIEEISDSRVQDNGFDYLENQEIGLWLQTDCADAFWPMIVRLLQEEKFMDNDLSASAKIYISENPSEDIDNCTLVYPI